MQISIQIHVEHEITPDDHEKITALRNVSFPDYQYSRSYFKQLPHLRVLARHENEIVGHVGIDHRAIRFGSEVARVFGVIDLCVSHKYRGHGIAGKLLTETEKISCQSGADAIFLVAEDKRLYHREGFTEMDAHCTWLRIDDHSSHGIASEEITGELMIKRLNPDLKLEGPIDLLGYLY